MNVKIVLTEEQQTWLLRFLNREWDEELEYQHRNNEPDTTYLEDMLDVYEALLGKTNSWIIAMVNADDINNKKKELMELKNLCAG